MRTGAYRHRCLYVLAGKPHGDFNAGTTASSKLLPDVPAVESGWLTIALFSQPDCVFCEEVRENCLKPLLAARPGHIAAAEFQLNGSGLIKAWSQGTQSEAEFARQQRARFAPTLMFFGPLGEQLAPPIVGLSRDFFGAYPDQRIQAASRHGRLRGRSGSEDRLSADQGHRSEEQGRLPDE